MDIKVNQVSQVPQPVKPQEVKTGDDTFKFMLVSNIVSMMEEITMQGKKLAKHRDIRDMKQYRTLIKSFMNEIVNHSHQFSRENFLDRKGRHRVYGIIRLIDENLDKLAQALVEDEQDNIDILKCIGEIEGLILDIFT